MRIDKFLANTKIGSKGSQDFPEEGKSECEW